MADQARIRAVEEASFTSWPCLQQVLDDGWVIRLAGGHTKRANSVNPIYPSTEDPARKIERAEALFHAHGLPTVYRLTPLAEAQGLDALLSARGYRELDLSRAMVLEDLATVPRTPVPAGLQLRLDPTPDQGWLDAYLALSPVSADGRRLLGRMLEAIAAPACFATLTEDGRPVAAALGVAAGDWLGFYEVVTAPEMRGRGLMRHVFGELGAWGLRSGARHGQLFVVAGNEPAERLYEGLGFRELYRYHYRLKPSE